jgi:hypothetical protein
MSVLERIGVVRPEYRHISKRVTAAPSIALADAVLKWYEIAPQDAPVPAEIRALAQRDLREASTADSLGLDGDLGFVILHRCGESFYFLLVATWRNDNELWETVWAKDGDADATFRPWLVAGAHRPTFCVWELAAVCNEQRAWSRFLYSPRDELAKQAYLTSAYEGSA